MSVILGDLSSENIHSIRFKKGNWARLSRYACSIRMRLDYTEGRLEGRSPPKYSETFWIWTKTFSHVMMVQTADKKFEVC